MFFPCVGHAVEVGVEICCTADFGIIIPCANVVLRIRQAGQSGDAAFEFGCATADFGDDALIVFVESGEIAADVGEDVGVGLMGRMGFDV